MSRQHPRQSGASCVALLSAGLVFAWASSGWAGEARLAAPGGSIARSQSWPGPSSAEQSPLTQAAFQEQAAPLAGPKASNQEGFHDAEGERVDLTADAAPRVEVRVGNHGDFERVVFEWPAAIDYAVEQRSEQVTVAFSRRGRIDLSPIADHLGRRVLGSWAEDGEVTGSITLRVLPNARIHSFSLEGGRVVVIDVFGAAQTFVPFAPNPERDALQELRRALAQRDAVIENLLARFEQMAARIEQLERTVALSGGGLDRVTAGRAMATPSVESMPPPQSNSQSAAATEDPSGKPPDGSPEAPSEDATPEQQAEKTSQAQTSETTGARGRQETAQAETSAPGQVEIDEEAVERALDFTLVQEGALLLPVGRAELTPSFTYTRRTTDFPVIVAEQEVRRNEFEFSTALLLGLPLDSQLELRLPYNLVDQATVDKVLGIAVQESSRTGDGLGDFSVGLAKTLLRERNWWPDVVLRLNWDTGTGDRSDNDIVLDAGFQELMGSVSLAKRQDPLVFVAGASYETAFEEDDITPGDTLGFSVGTFLAASPNTSLRLVLNQSFIDELKVDGRSINGSDRVQSLLTLGASAILGRDVLLDGAVGVGLTDDSPDYAVSVSLPIRFNTPGF